MKRKQLVAEALADALLAGTPEVDGMISRSAWVLGRKHRWIAPLCKRVFRQFGSSLESCGRSKLVDWIRNDRGYHDAWQAARSPRIAHYVLDPPRMRPRKGALAACAIPDLPTPGDLAAWLGISVTELDWFADVRAINPAEGQLAHYRYVWVPKSHGMRLTEVPKIRLRDIQRKILRGILDPVPVHAAAHGFRQGKSCRTYVEPHIGREMVLRVDLRDFFPSIPAGRVHALFSTLGYPEAVARTLTGLCTNAVPMSVARHGAESWLAAKRLGAPHLPQGAPTSPALANLCALHLDLRIDELARSMDGQYTRYADDLAISGGEALRRRISAVTNLVTVIAVEEGFAVNHRKTRAMHRSHRQLLTGVVINDKPNVRREDFDRLKAILTNCVRHGPISQDRDRERDFKAHLAGRIAHVASLNWERGKKLQEIFRRIDWAANVPRATPSRA
jgi:RNA-directed DNA polymerase